ncbi:bifunctional glutamate--cysteine ligase GshA/glutathione synthetase GshB [Sulfuriroseicoccus oceanibius]|uniref:Glutamate--cysteine ligase n=1 Tax=Sulfuriroseicoccus oceanibius TaxID=2707525 RepID=A0A6B3L9W1_9BACT|nr:bifunctional glutamate--cysteine ligase GshA/glutathione synthetase GshB [Sulfuriroseicoccus oceanibius]QQL44449.1 bifunctional glutamate--cysteine ligase GshA/glutathione synthetase GshB [Sulfuriroseicoccus oceanibius]
MNIGTAITSENCSPWLLGGNFGIEKEHIRVDRQGNLALTPHPTAFGDKLANPYVTVDFSESQLEMITPPMGSAREAIGFLETIHDVVSESLDDEYLWPQSMPPELPEDGSKIPIAQFSDDFKALNEYRYFLAQTYGRKRQLISGVHINLSFAPELIACMRTSLGLESVPLSEFKSQIYMKALRNMMRFRWMPLALLGNSPAVHNSYAETFCEMQALGPDSRGNPLTTSIRASQCGYRNKLDFILDYSDWPRFHRSLRNLVESKQLVHEKELYNPIRVKTDLTSGEITHLEIRLVDLDPTVKTGVRPESLHLLHLFMLWAIAIEEPGEFDEVQQLIASKNQYNCACCGLKSRLKTIAGDELTEEEASNHVDSFLTELSALVPASASEAQDYQASIETLRTELKTPTSSPLEIVRKGVIEQGFIQYHLTQAQHFAELSQVRGFRFNGLEDLELSTQLMLREAIVRGVTFELLDRSENFVKFSRDGHDEFVQQATKTSKDRYSAVLMMENKLVTKKVLAAAGLSVPPGGHYTDQDQARAEFPRYQGRPIVIKPKSTNFGLGITILKRNDDPLHFERALEMAFSADSSVLVEPFAAGREFRFFLIGDHVEAILHRVPANVRGDGHHTIAELIERKNQSPLRGKGYRTPLELIATGQAEQLFLETQGLSFESVPDSGETIFLRENSNISTGGDSIDFTDDVHASYKEIAVQAAQAMGVAITGLDMIIADITTPATDENHSIIEMNFNPAIHIHCFPFQGENRHLNAKLMDFLGY